MSPDVLVSSPGPLRITMQMRDAALTAPGGWLYSVDPHFDPAGDVPERGLMGVADRRGRRARHGVSRQP